MEQRFRFTCSKGLCDNCLLPGHLVSVCPKSCFCKIPGCQLKHLTYLHPIEGTHGNEQCAREENAIGDGLSTDGNSSSDTGTQTSHISVDSQCALIGVGHSATALPIVPVKVKARGSNRTALTYALLDGGSNTMFGTHKLMQSLGIDGERTQLSLNTLRSHNCITDCALFSLEVFDLEDNNFVELPTVFSSRPPRKQGKHPTSGRCDQISLSQRHSNS